MKIPLRSSRKDPIRSELASLAKKLGKLYDQEAKKLPHRQETFDEAQALHVALRCLKETQYTVEQFLAGHRRLGAQMAAAFLEGQREQVLKAAEKERIARHVRAGQVSIQTMNYLFLAENEIAEDFPARRSPAPDKPATAQVSRVVITSDLLYQIHHSLFPAEKMLVASGRRGDGAVKIGAVFDVTGDHSMGHVKANPSRLARALISMSLSDTHFAMWLHSHPGIGKEATRPSSIDLVQHQDWLRDYSPNLISAIMVQDRWVRFWGTALDAGKAEIEIVGPGVIKEEGNAIYRLEQ